VALKKLLVLAFLTVTALCAQGKELPLKLSQGEGRVEFSVKGRAQVELRILNDTGRELFLQSYSKP